MAGSEEKQPGFIPSHGGYRELASFKTSELVYDATIKFCNRFIDQGSRTHDQMVQAARSGNKNIAEGSQMRCIPEPKYHGPKATCAPETESPSDMGPIRLIPYGTLRDLKSDSTQIKKFTPVVLQE